MAITNIKKIDGTSVNPILSANIDTIDFNNIPAGSKGAKGLAFWNDKANINVWKDGGDGTQWKPAINAVDIDWNGAQVCETTLNTTGEMLSILQTAYNYATTYNVKYDDGKLYDDKGTEIKVGSDYSLPTASSDKLGGVKAAAVRTSAITTTQGGTTTNRYYGVEIDSNGKAFVNVPWTDTDKNDTVTSVSNHYKPNNTDQTKSSGLYKITTDAAGHITSATLVTQDDIVALIGDYFDSRYQKNKDVQISIPTSITRTKSSTVTSISKTGGSFSPAEIKVGEKSTITAPTSIEVTYSLTNTTDTVTISGADAVNQTPIVTSSNPNVITVSGTTLTAKAAGKSTITVVCNGVTKEQEVSVENANNKETKTSGWEYSASNNCVTITDKQIEGISAGTPTIYVTYDNKNASLGTLTVKSAATYYWYVGQTDPANLSESFNPGDNLATDYVSGGGWYLFGDAVPETIQQLVKGGDATKYWYVAMPITTPTTLKPVATDMTTLDTTAQAQTIKPFAGVNYQVYWYSGGAGARNTFRFAKK